jgi:hypothetical protein
MAIIGRTWANLGDAVPGHGAMPSCQCRPGGRPYRAARRSRRHLNAKSDLGTTSHCTLKRQRDFLPHPAVVKGIGPLQSFRVNLLK